MKCLCLYLLMGFNVYLAPLVQVDGATLISTISLVDVEVESFSPYIYVPTPWAKHTKTTVWRAPSLKNPSCSKLDLFLLLLPSPPPPRCSALLCPIVALTCSSSSWDQQVRSIVAVLWFRCLRIVQHFSVALTIFISHLLGCFSLFLSQQDNKSSCSCPDAVRLLDQAPYKLACMP